ncbi:MAG: hypothetical protein KGZ45_04905 [Clostridium sp.]|nr:hypothetical protein [Clostridium sp.]
MESKVTVLKIKLVEALNILREAVEISLEIKALGTAEQQEANGLWSLFLQEFFGYIKKRSCETKKNLLAGVRFPRL